MKSASFLKKIFIMDNDYVKIDEEQIKKYTQFLEKLNSDRERVQKEIFSLKAKIND